MEIEKRTDFPMSDDLKYCFPVGSLVWVTNKKHPILVGDAFNHDSPFGVIVGFASVDGDYIPSMPLAWNPFMSEMYAAIKETAEQKADASYEPRVFDIYQNKYQKLEFVAVMSRYYDYRRETEMVRYSHNSRGNGNMTLRIFEEAYLQPRYNKYQANGRMEHLNGQQQRIFGVKWLPRGYVA
jgi:hypothetical protein